MTHLPFFEVNLPGNANLFNKNLIAIANFEIIDIGIITELIFYFPDEDPYSLPLQRSGYDSKYLLLGLGFSLYTLTLYVVMVAVFILLYPFSKCFEKVKKIRDKMREILFWNMLIRLFIELYLDFLVYAIINTKTSDWEFYDILHGPTTSNILSFALCFSIPVLPIILIILYCRKRNQWNEESFDKRYGAFLDGLDLKREKD